MIRIVPLYWLLTTLKILGVVLLPTIILRTSIDIYSVAASYLFLPVVDTAGNFRPVLPVGWTLTYEFLFYLFFAAALALRVDVLRIVAPGLGLIAAVALFRTANWPDWTILFSTIVLEFVFGVVLARWTMRGFRLAPAIATAFVLGGFVAILTMPMGSENLRVLTWGDTGICHRGRRRLTGAGGRRRAAAMDSGAGRRILFDLSQPWICVADTDASDRQALFHRDCGRKRSRSSFVSWQARSPDGSSICSLKIPCCSF